MAETGTLAFFSEISELHPGRTLAQAVEVALKSKNDPVFLGKFIGLKDDPEAIGMITKAANARHGPKAQEKLKEMWEEKVTPDLTRSVLTREAQFATDLSELPEKELEQFANIARAKQPGWERELEDLYLGKMASLGKKRYLLDPST